MLFQLDSVCATYGDTPVLRGVSLAVEREETLALVGSSGCGKSTILKLMLGLLQPSSGSVRFEGEPITPASAPEMRLKMGYVIQGGGLFPHLTAAGNAGLMGRHLGWGADRLTSRLVELAAICHLDADLLGRYPSELSGGQRQRVALMRALLLEPDVLLLDEPFGALDTLVRHSLQDELKEVFDRLGKTVVLVTHDMTEAAFFSDRIALMQEGAVLQTGSAEDLVRRPASPFVAEFLGAHRPLPQEKYSGAKP